MRLLTHNYLQSNVKGTTKGYPLIIKATKVVLEKTPLDKEMLLRILSKIEYNTLIRGCQQILISCKEAQIDLPTLPEEIPAKIMNSQFNDDDDGNEVQILLENLFLVLFEIHILEGVLVCPDTGREFPIKDGIPNMILHEDEL